MFVFELTWTTDFTPDESSTLTSLRKDLKQAARTLKAMEAGGVELGAYDRAAEFEGYTTLITFDPEVAEEFAMFDQVTVYVDECSPAQVEQFKQCCASQGVGLDV